ncbi:MAG TPA: amidase family protein [Pyrinomonadaceae bacterium]|nr:amidase family protein [Pyrinomonadaceae bacterium]
MATRIAATDITELSADELARSIASGEVSSREAVEALVRRIEQVNPRLNSFVVERFAEARKEADLADARRARGEPSGLLDGVPITIKESYDVQGLPSTVGLASRASHKAESDAPTVARLREAGAVILGKTNVPQLVMLNETDNPVYGRTNNPWNLERAVGGSSGGCAATVASGGAPLSLGSDIGGSVRLPANACGIHSLKPTSTRLTMRGHVDVFPGQEAIICQPGPLARSVADLSLAMRILAAPGQEAIDPSVPPVAWRDPAAVSLAGLRVAFYTDNGVIRPAPAARRAVDAAARALAARGVEVEEWTPPDVREAWRIYRRLLFADATRVARRIVGRDPRDWRINIFLRTFGLPRSLLRIGAWELSLLGQKYLAESARLMGRQHVDEYWQAVSDRRQYRARFIESLDAGRFDAILCPVEAVPAVPHGGSFYLVDSISYTSLYNLLGMPAGVVAATRVRASEETDRAPRRDLVERAALKAERGSAGLPVGVQVVARHWREEIALALMSALEEHFSAQPDYPARPPLPELL